MKISIPLPAVVQVVNVRNYKGSPRAVLLVDGKQMLYADGHVEDEELASSVFQAALGRMFVHYLKEHEPFLLSYDEGNWSTETDRDINAEQYETTALAPEHR